MGSVAIMEAVDQLDLEDRFIAEITDRYHRIARDVIEIGASLAKAKQQLPHGRYERMIAEKLPFSARTAHSYVQEWLFASGQIQTPGSDLTQHYTVRREILRLTEPEQLQGIKDGWLYPDVPREQVIENRQRIRSLHEHRPIALQTPAPSRPEQPGATTYGEMVYLLTAWRSVRGLPQTAVDHLVGSAEGQTGKYEIPHTDDGRTLTWKALFELCAVYRIGVQFVPLDAA